MSQSLVWSTKCIIQFFLENTENFVLHDNEEEMTVYCNYYHGIGPWYESLRGRKWDKISNRQNRQLWPCSGVYFYIGSYGTTLFEALHLDVFFFNFKNCLSCLE